MCHKLLYVLSVVFVLSLVGNAFCQEPERDLDIPYAFEPPVLDGEVDELWEAVSKQEITVFIQGDPASSTLDISATWQVMWDVDYLYAIVELFDDSLQNDSTNTWQDDSVEFYFDGGNSKEVWEAGNLTVYEDNRQTTFGWTTEEVQGNNSNPEGIEHAQVTTPTGWRTEMKIPWISLQGKEPIVGDLIGIDCGLNDDDDGDDTRETQMATYSIDNNFWRDPSQWGTALLTLGDLNIAYGPDPSNGSVIESAWTQLKWRANPAAVSHNIYVGEDFDEVNAGTGDTFWGNQAITNLIVGFPGFPFPGGLIGGTTYYWRIDEVNEADPTAPWKGMIWSFSIPPKTAQSPDPADGTEFVALDANLTWEPGHGAKLHTLYFGESFEDVNGSTAGTPLGVATYSPGPLEPEKVLYWRVDEFDGAATYKGDVWGFTTTGAAGNPDPANGDNATPLNATLAWTPADTAASHHVYLGTDADAVRNATTSSPEYMGSKTKGSESHNPGKLEWDTNYFWRVDAVYTADPGNPVQGLVWAFKTADFISVDDFESYNDIDPPEEGSNRIFDMWIDGFGTTTNGALVGNDLPPYAGQIIVHGGLQSMPYFYDNNLKTSEATQTLVYPRDWTDEGVTELSIWFAGKSTNAAERMFVALNGTAAIYNDDPAAAQNANWTKWVIPLQAFADQGVNLANVNTITIGFGTKNSPAAGGTGMMYFDDIQLNRPAVETP
jgi:hypothetical protein